MPEETRLTGEKYNWPALKLEYFQSTFRSAEEFMEAKYGTKSGFIRKNIVGWVKEKNLMIEEATKNAIEKMKTDVKLKYKIDLSNLHVGKKAIFGRIFEMLGGQPEKDRYGKIIEEEYEAEEKQADGTIAKVKKRRAKMKYRELTPRELLELLKALKLELGEPISPGEHRAGEDSSGRPVLYERVRFYIPDNGRD